MSGATAPPDWKLLSQMLLPSDNTLAEMLASAASNSDFAPAVVELLGKFAAWRADDRKGVTRFTDSLVKLFGSNAPDGKSR